MMFQFLIGKLTTEELKEYTYSGASFQFLIGKLTTIYSFRDAGLPENMFQFLIGKLTTSRRREFNLTRRDVSIPYR
ncbi:Hypothetical protein DPCES_3022 [Desulfitobacterium hafniense]|uniref:Uncharacterized protein n=1 Tax=Desulfitobacterium hafniense TaxID=49338 RepID=A0A098B215_DESHA|nr:Hypothetical protein DPCES_3022 [Desulfitobacterium hafniense]